MRASNEMGRGANATQPEVSASAQVWGARRDVHALREKKDVINKRDVRSKELEKGSDSPEVAHAPHRTFCADFFNGRMVPAQLGAEQRA